MTFCIAMKVQSGLIAMADTRVTTGTECITVRKISIHEHNRHSLFVMTSGLRSVRDKAVTYFDEVLTESDDTFDKLYKAVNAFAQQVRRVAAEDKKALEESGIAFNLHALVGGQLEKDGEHKLYLLYPQGNWIEVRPGTPYCMIGESSYGKPLLDRALRYESSMDLAVKIGFLAFDATRTSATDVNYPLDVVLYTPDSYQMHMHRYEQEDLMPVSNWWRQRLLHALHELPADWVNELMAHAPRPTAVPKP